MIELKEQLTQLKDQLAQTRGALYKKEGANEELQQQLAIAESRSHSLQEELKSLNEQLTEVIYQLLSKALLVHVLLCTCT